MGHLTSGGWHCGDSHLSKICLYSARAEIRISETSQSHWKGSGCVLGQRRFSLCEGTSQLCLVSRLKSVLAFIHLCSSLIATAHVDGRMG